MFGSAPQKPKPIAETHILVIEDKKFVRELLHHLLKKIGVSKVSAARTAEDALYNLKKNPALFDVVLLDFGLPGMSGLKFLERLRDKRASQKLQNLPVIIVTSETDPRLFQKMRALKISGFLLKPVGKNALLSALERALRQEAIPPVLTKEHFVTPEPAQQSDRKGSRSGTPASENGASTGSSKPNTVNLKT